MSQQQQQTVDHQRVRDAMWLAGRKLEARLVVSIAVRNGEIVEAGGHICDSLEPRLGQPCTWPAVTLYACGWRCQWHTPAAFAGRPEPVSPCNKPVRCYCPKCVRTLDVVEAGAA